MAKLLGLITSSLASLGLGTIGPRAITLRGPRSVTPFLMPLGRKLRTVIAYKGFKCITLRVEALDLEQEPS